MTAATMFTAVQKARTPFENFVRQTFLEATKSRPFPYYSLRRQYNHENIVVLPPFVEHAFGWKLLLMKPWIDVSTGNKVYGTKIIGQATGEDLIGIFQKSYLSPYFVITTNSDYRQFHSKFSAWAFDPDTANYSIAYTMADVTIMPDMTRFQTAMGGELALALLRMPMQSSQ